MKTLTPFVLNHTLQVVLGSHLVPADEKILNASKWLGLLPEEESIETASDTLKSTVRKTDAPLFSHLLRCLATDEELAADFNLVKNPLPEEGVNLMDAPSRMEAMFANPLSKQKKKVVKKKKAKVPAKTKAAKKTVKKTTGKAPAAKRTTTTKKVPKKKSSSTKK